MKAFHTASDKSLGDKPGDESRVRRSGERERERWSSLERDGSLSRAPALLQRVYMIDHSLRVDWLHGNHTTFKDTFMKTVSQYNC